MNKHKYSPAEIAAWKRGKIAAYYAEKARQHRLDAEQIKSRSTPKYSSFDADAALASALNRTYGGKK